MKMSHGVSVVLLLGKRREAMWFFGPVADPLPSLHCLHDVPVVLSLPSVRGRSTWGLQQEVLEKVPEEEENERQGKRESGTTTWPPPDRRTGRSQAPTATFMGTTIVSSFIVIRP